MRTIFLFHQAEGLSFSVLRIATVPKPIWPLAQDPVLRTLCWKKGCFIHAEETYEEKLNDKCFTRWLLSLWRCLIVSLLMEFRVGSFELRLRKIENQECTWGHQSLKKISSITQQLRFNSGRLMCPPFTQMRFFETKLKSTLPVGHKLQ